jgi:lysophospholipase L1-like esterase
LSHGALYVDILADFRALPGPEHGYYPLDGHPNAQGQAVLARLIAQRLGGAIPEVPATASAN